MRRAIAMIGKPFTRKQKALLVAALVVFVASAVFCKPGLLLAVTLLTAAFFVEDGVAGLLSIVGLLLSVYSSVSFPSLLWPALGLLIVGAVISTVRASKEGHRV
ncbi:MAG: hypothetical protein ACREVR_09250 [Burkholderiales bacterium]